MLVDAKVAPNPSDASLSALHSAVTIGSAAMIRLLIAAGVNTSTPDASFGATPYDWAWKVGTVSAEVMDLLQVDRDRIRVRVPDGGLRWSD
jgi:ankyrin repeat protein